MAVRLPEALAIQMQNKAQPDIPAAESSGIELSPMGKLCQEARGEVAELIKGRFVQLHGLSHKAHRDFDALDEKSRYPTVSETAGSFDLEGFERVTGYQKSALLMRLPGQGREEAVAALSAHCDGVQIQYPNETAEELLAPTAAHYARGVQNNLKMTDIISSRDNFFLVCVKNGQGRILPEDGFLKSSSIDWAKDDSFQPLMVEGPREVGIDMNDRDSLASTLTARIKHKDEARQSGEQGMTYDLYAQLAQQSIVRKGEMIDDLTITVMDGEPVVANRYVPVAHCRNGHPTFEWLLKDDIGSGRVRFRKVLAGNAIMP